MFLSLLKADLSYLLEMFWRFPKSFTAPLGQLGELVSTDSLAEKM